MPEHSSYNPEMDRRYFLSGGTSGNSSDQKLNNIGRGLFLGALGSMGLFAMMTAFSANNTEEQEVQFETEYNTPVNVTVYDEGILDARSKEYQENNVLGTTEEIELTEGTYEVEVSRNGELLEDTEVEIDDSTTYTI